MILGPTNRHHFSFHHLQPFSKNNPKIDQHVVARTPSPAVSFINDIGHGGHTLTQQTRTDHVTDTRTFPIDERQRRRRRRRRQAFPSRPASDGRRDAHGPDSGPLSRFLGPIPARFHNPEDDKALVYYIQAARLDSLQRFEPEKIIKKIRVRKLAFFLHLALDRN